MIHVSAEMYEKMSRNTDFRERATITFLDGKELKLTYKDFTITNNNLTDSADVDGIPLGVAVCRGVQIEIMNDDDHLSEYDFIGANVQLEITYQLANRIEVIQLGNFTVAMPETYGTTVIIQAVDGMYKANRDYDSDLSYPTTAQNILVDACRKLNIPIGNTNFRNKDFVVQKKPENATYREVIGYVAMLAVGNARIDRMGYLQIQEYDFSVFDKLSTVSGGTFSTKTTPYSDGDEADGGNFTDYASGDSLDGGTFTDTPDYAYLTNWKSIKVDTDDVVVTGVRTTYKDGDEDKTILYGVEGYVIEVSNPMILGQEQKILKSIGDVIIGHAFRPFQGDYIAYPLLEFMDNIVVVDRKGNEYQSFVTDYTFVVGGITTIKNSAQSAIRNSSKAYSQATKTIVEMAKNQSKKQLTEYDKSVQMLTQLMSQSFGIFKTEQVLEDGSTVYYMHNKPLLKDSDTQWKMTANALAVSTDFGKTWKAGIDSQGNAVVNVLSAVGINADWVNAGILQGMTIIGSEIISNGTLVFHHENYTSADLERANNIILNKIVPTLADYRKYDIDGNGIITMSDYVKIEKLVGGQDYSYEVNMRVNPSYNNDVITVETEGQATLIMSRKGINCNSFTANGFHLNNSNGNYHAFSNGVELSGVSGTIKDSYGQTITVANGIIVGII